jgi:hypothetical protein
MFEIFNNLISYNITNYTLCIEKTHFAHLTLDDFDSFGDYMNSIPSVLYNDPLYELKLYPYSNIGRAILEGYVLDVSMPIRFTHFTPHTV